MELQSFFETARAALELLKAGLFLSSWIGGWLDNGLEFEKEVALFNLSTHNP